MTPGGRQSGAATLMVATLLLAAATLLALYVTRPIAAEMRLAAGDMRNQQAFQAAQAAIDRGLAHLADTRDTDTTALNAEGAAAARRCDSPICTHNAMKVQSLAEMTKHGDKPVNRMGRHRHSPPPTPPMRISKVMTR